MIAPRTDCFHGLFENMYTDPEDPEPVLEVKIRRVDSIVIVEPSGRITMDHGDRELRNQVHQAIWQGGRNFLINFKDVPYLDSSGLGVLVSLYTSLTNNGGSLKFLHLNSKIRQVLDLTQLLRLFECFDDEEAALKSFD